jgi:integrative and conjugative element protein (TIGR02256 family)
VRACGIHIAAGVREHILQLAIKSGDGRETGGILLGRGPAPDGVIPIEIAGDPGPAADRRPNFFLRDLAHAEALANAAWERSRAIWVGEWHTHPTGGSQPSASDLSTYTHLLAASALDFEVFVSVIVTPDDAKGWEAPQLWPWLLELQAEENAAFEDPSES